MIYRFLVLSNEVPDFAREISIDSDATFLDFHDALLNAVNFHKGEMASFFVCNEDWEREQEITLMEMDSNDSEYDILLMENTSVYDLISDEGQRMQFVFDYMSDRAFFLELKEIVTSKDLKEPACTYSVGNPPAQTIDLDSLDEPQKVANPSVDEDFYGTDSYNSEELDADGFTDLDGNDMPSSPSNDDIF